MTSVDRTQNRWHGVTVGARLITVLLPMVPVIIALNACAQGPSSGAALQFPKIESAALKGNLIGDPAVREMVVLLPPSYQRSTSMRYPVVYYLHGLGTRENGGRGSIDMLTKMYGLMKEQKLYEMIVVAVDGTTIFGGSYYADSPTIGNFERYVTGEIVSRIDSLFRTRSDRENRAIAGFSMGGYGAIKLGMKYSSVFGQVASLSGSPLSIRYRKSVFRNALVKHIRPRTLEGLKDSITFEKDWSLAGVYAKAAAFSPNPSRPPLFLDLPFERQGPEERDPVWQKWMDDDPLFLVSRYQDNLRSLEQIYIDHGDDETTLGTEDFIRELVRYDVGFTHFVFRGDHVDELFLRHLRMFRSIASRWQYR